MTTICKDFSYRDQHYSIVYDGKFYMTVNHKFIGSDGRLTKELRYNDGLHPGRTMDETIKSTKDDLDIKHYLSIGMSKAEAFAKVCDIPLEIAKTLF